MTKQTAQPRKLRFLIPVIAFVGFALIAAFGLLGTINGTRNSDQLPSVLIGKLAPELPATALNDELARPLSDFAGEPVLVNMMASWCAPCRAELPALDLLNPFEAVWMDYDGTNGIKWGIYGVPETFLLDGQGRVVLRHAGPIFKDTITDVIKPALAELAR